MKLKFTQPQQAAIARPYDGKGPLPQGTSWPSGSFVFMITVTRLAGPPKWHASVKLMNDQNKVTPEKSMSADQVNDLMHHTLWLLEGVGEREGQAWRPSPTGPHLFRRLTAEEIQIMAHYTLQRARRNGR